MNAEIVVVLVILALTVIALLFDRWRPSHIFGAAALCLLISGQISVGGLLSGFSNPSIITVFLLIILTSIINENFNLVGLFDRLFASVKSQRQFVLKMGFSVAALSSVMNNTPIVAMMIPYVYQWGKKYNVSPSKLLIPLSYATILGGMITVLGTSTNMVLIGFIQEKNAPMLGFLDFLIPGILVTIAGVAFIAFFGNRLLPNHKDLIGDATANFKEYLVETKIEVGSDMVGKSIQEAGLRNLDGIFLVEILRNKQTISPVSPDEYICSEDRLYFAGEPEKVFELVKNQPGISIPSHTPLEIGAGMNILESVIPANSNLVGRTLKDLEFRENYDAAVIAIHRNGEKLRGKIGDIRLDKGDLLLISAGRTFVSKNRAGKDLYLVSEIKRIAEKEPGKKKLFLILSAIAIGLSIAGFIQLFVVLLIMLGLSLVFHFTDYERIKRNVSLDLLIILGCAIALSNAIIGSGCATWLSAGIIDGLGNSGLIFMIVLIYFLTVILTQFITNAAAIAIVFPIGLALFTQTGIDPKGIFIAMAFGASCCFLTPVGYQTNLMVFGPGNYRFKDFVRIGIPLTIIYSTIVLTWIIYQYT